MKIDISQAAERNKQFAADLNRRVHDYFSTAGRTPHANFAFYFKAVFMAFLYWIPFVLMLFGIGGTPMFWVAWILMGLGMAGIGMNVMHDANHGSASKYKGVNKLLGASMYLLSGYVLTWQIQHNHLHHNFTNHLGHDEDLETRGLLRLHPEDKWHKAHRFQAWYSPFIYGLLTLNWALYKDFGQVKRYSDQGLLKRFNAKFNIEITRVTLTKILYLGTFLALPIITGHVWWMVLPGFVAMHFIAGFVLSFVFQLAHVVPNVDHPVGMEIKGPGAWQVNQLMTTANFAMKNPVITWGLGGLNHQVEHHLFPHISHVHYPALSKIVKSTAEEHGLPYFQYKRMWQAVVAHLRFLNTMGKNPVVGMA